MFPGKHISTKITEVRFVLQGKRVTITSTSDYSCARRNEMKEWLWSGKPWQAFKNVAIILSFTLNIVFLIVVIVVAFYIIPVVDSIAEPIVGGLHQSFVDMGEAHIVRTIAVEDTIPVVFDLPVETTTIAKLTEPVPMSIPTTFVLPGGGGFINGNVSFELPAGTDLPVHFSTMVPVSQTVPVNLNVTVDIPLNETELGGPFGELQALFTPLDAFLTNLPSTNSEMYDRIINSVGEQEAADAVEQASAPLGQP